MKTLILKADFRCSSNYPELMELLPNFIYYSENAIPLYYLLNLLRYHCNMLVVKRLHVMTFLDWPVPLFQSFITTTGLCRIYDTTAAPKLIFEYNLLYESLVDVCKRPVSNTAVQITANSVKMVDITTIEPF